MGLEYILGPWWYKIYRDFYFSAVDKHTQLGVTCWYQGIRAKAVQSKHVKIDTQL